MSCEVTRLLGFSLNTTMYNYDWYEQVATLQLSNHDTLRSRYGEHVTPHQSISNLCDASCAATGDGERLGI
jgi:hypothetical protein